VLNAEGILKMQRFYSESFLENEELFWSCYICHYLGVYKYQGFNKSVNLLGVYKGPAFMGTRYCLLQESFKQFLRRMVRGVWWED
jgi:hypothetical protein